VIGRTGRPDARGALSQNISGAEQKPTHRISVSEKGVKIAAEEIIDLVAGEATE